MAQQAVAVPQPPAEPKAGTAPRRGKKSILPAIKQKGEKKDVSRGEIEGLLTMGDMNAIKGFIHSNKNIPFKHRRGDLQKLIPKNPFRKVEAPCDSITGLQLAALTPLESSIDVPIRFEPPVEYHPPPLVDPRSTASEVEQLFTFMKRTPYRTPQAPGNSNTNNGGNNNNPSEPTSPNPKATGSSSSRSGKNKASVSGFKSLDPKDYMLRALTCRRAGQRKQEAIAYFNMAALNYTQNDYERAADLLGKCVAIMEKLSDRVGLAVVQNLLGVCCYRIGTYKVALHHYKKQESLCGYYGRAVAQINMGVTYSALGEKTFAVQALMDAVDNARMTQDMCIESIALGNLGLAHLRNGNLRAAQEGLEACMELCSLNGDEAGAAICLLLLGEVYSLVNDHKRAQFYFSNARTHSTFLC
eukprot:TRINITY_DN8279_c0_g3_i1.p1 TRINITY_DN8279_c0_g3~~TRINITY_DN8279_c0_g3_i1.p1  ORF type:complete len:414 (+),score=106.87 TRINITY_DN8279_c0_g3_i1:71-1312(+)